MARQTHGGSGEPRVPGCWPPRGPAAVACRSRSSLREVARRRASCVRQLFLPETTCQLPCAGSCLLICGYWKNGKAWTAASIFRQFEGDFIAHLQLDESGRPGTSRVVTPGGGVGRRGEAGLSRRNSGEAGGNGRREAAGSGGHGNTRTCGRSPRLSPPPARLRHACVRRFRSSSSVRKTRRVAGTTRRIGRLCAVCPEKHREDAEPF